MKSINLSLGILFGIIILLCNANTIQSQNSFFNDSLASKKHFNIELLGNFTAKSNAFPNSFYTLR